MHVFTFVNLVFISYDILFDLAKAPESTEQTAYHPTAFRFLSVILPPEWTWTILWWTNVIVCLCPLNKHFIRFLSVTGVTNDTLKSNSNHYILIEMETGFSLTTLQRSWLLGLYDGADVWPHAARCGSLPLDGRV